MVKSQYLRTLPIGMLYFDTMYGRQTNLIMAASVMAVVPPLILFVVGQKFLVRGIQLGAVKGRRRRRPRRAGSLQIHGGSARSPAACGRSRRGDRPRDLSTGEVSSGGGDHRDRIGSFVGADLAQDDPAAASGSIRSSSTQCGLPLVDATSAAPAVWRTRPRPQRCSNRRRASQLSRSSSTIEGSADRGGLQLHHVQSGGHDRCAVTNGEGQIRQRGKSS
jgi:hypothetical protein